jgi:hypothetical protein
LSLVGSVDTDFEGSRRSFDARISGILRLLNFMTFVSVSGLFQLRFKVGPRVQIFSTTAYHDDVDDDPFTFSLSLSLSLLHVHFDKTHKFKRKSKFTSAQLLYHSRNRLLFD